MAEQRVRDPVAETWPLRVGLQAVDYHARCADALQFAAYGEGLSVAERLEYQRYADESRRWSEEATDRLLRMVRGR